MKLATDFALFCTRKTTPLLSTVEDLVSQLESDASFDYTAAPSGYPLTAITVGMALSSMRSTGKQDNGNELAFSKGVARATG